MAQRLLVALSLRRLATQVDRQAGRSIDSAATEKLTSPSFAERRLRSFDAEYIDSFIIRSRNRLRNKETDSPAAVEPVSRGSLAFDIEALAAKVTATDHAAPNGSSIAILPEHQRAAVQLGADAFQTVMVPALKALALQRRVPGGLHLDAIKLSHHGSRGNVTTELLKAVTADHYIFSTSNAIFRHPDDEAVARVLVDGGRQPTLWFNYATERNRRWADEGLKARHGYQARLPEGGKAGVTIAVPPRDLAKSLR